MLAPLATAPARYCGCNGRDTTLTIDHVTPVSKGGRNTWINLVTACMACNQRKGDKTLQQLGWKLRSVPKVRGAGCSGVGEGKCVLQRNHLFGGG